MPLTGPIIAGYGDFTDRLGAAGHEQAADYFRDRNRTCEAFAELRVRYRAPRLLARINALRDELLLRPDRVVVQGELALLNEAAAELRGMLTEPTGEDDSPAYA